MTHYVYILRCSDDSFYVGSSHDIEQRVKAHNDGKATSFTRSRRSVSLVYSEECKSKVLALHRERQIKKWSRAKKEAIISEDIERLKQLSKHRG